jgi:hypothetical protein
MIGLGLTALAYGTRYRSASDGGRLGVIHLDEVDRPLIFVLIFLACVAVIGLGIAFFGLAYHHRRRNDELALEHERHAARQRTQV